MCPSASGLRAKTIYLIRHAETEENVRMKGFHDVGKALKNRQMPTPNDWKLGSEFVGMTLKGVTDSHLSSRGQRQVLQLKSILDDNGLLDEVDLIAHSPLRRAKETCYGIFGLAAGISDDDMTTTATTTEKTKTNKPVVELSCLQEITQLEHLTQGKRAVRKRINSFERWIESQGEDVSTIAIVGHSEYFMIMLGVSEKFKNCDVWKAVYEPGGKWTVLENEVRLDMFSSRNEDQGNDIF
ncbi:histidine phosphatase superfamily branch 1 protein [Nitzschia inconspicua]|uniref:Histidine phosphatase superfamily branch 1 protein n=1 Tax=Nitzschia inconspicua TaxID=303405 RepID=A0A9K3LCS4_9STRA|nr:histidine phosphatase superfamily branch 1 protein [Nitzschia inconspicua]